MTRRREVRWGRVSALCLWAAVLGSPAPVLAGPGWARTAVLLVWALLAGVGAWCVGVYWWRDAAEDEPW